jgi:ribokinase
VQNQPILILGHHGRGTQKIKVPHIPVQGESIIALESKFLKDGGKGSHQAIVINRLGGKAVLIAKMAKDQRSAEAISWLEEENIDISNIIRGEFSFFGGGFILVDNTGNNTIISVPGIQSTLTYQEVQPLIDRNLKSKIFVTGFEIPVKTALEASKHVKEHGLVTILNPAPAPIDLHERLEYIDFIIPNETEAKLLTGYKSNERVDEEQLIHAIIEKYGCKSVVITCGNKGAIGYHEGQLAHVPGIQINAIDTIGAGDTFIGAFSLWINKGESFLEALQYANFAAAFSVSKEGSIASFPTQSELTDFIKCYK